MEGKSKWLQTSMDLSLVFRTSNDRTFVTKCEHGSKATLSIQPELRELALSRGISINLTHLPHPRVPPLPSTPRLEQLVQQNKNDLSFEMYRVKSKYRTLVKTHVDEKKKSLDENVVRFWTVNAPSLRTFPRPQKHPYCWTARQKPGKFTSPPSKYN